MKKYIFLIIAVLLVSCKEETIPVVTVSMLPTTLLLQGEEPQFDTIPYQHTEILQDTMYLIMEYKGDSLVLDTLVLIDTLVIDTFRLDTFYIDIISLNGCVSYMGDKPYGPSLQEVGFCINEKEFLPVYLSKELQTAKMDYDTFLYVMPVRNTEAFMVHAYAVNPSGEVRSFSSHVRIADLESR